MKYKRNTLNRKETKLINKLIVRLVAGGFSRVAVPKSQSRFQSRGRGSNVAAGENDLEFEVTE